MKRAFFQRRNLMEFLQMVHDLVPKGDEVEVHLVTQSDLASLRQPYYFSRIDLNHFVMVLTSSVILNPPSRTKRSHPLRVSKSQFLLVLFDF
jgi:hypothetical protein